MTDSSPVDVHPLSPERQEDFLAFFDHERGPAFADNPRWARCYCHFYHVPAELDWEAFAPGENRTAMGCRIAVGEMEGFLAYAEGSVAGWLNAQPIAKLPHAFARLGVPAPDTPAHETAAIVCFIVAPAWRRRGVASALLRGALERLAARGLRYVYAYPFRTTDAAATAHYHGPQSLFDAFGFVPVQATEDVTVMRKRLAAS